MIKKLLLVRVKKMTSTRLDEAGLLPFVVGDPIDVQPLAWDPEQPVSHYGFVLEMKLKGWELVKKWADANGDTTLLDLIIGKKERSIEDALKSVGLQVHPAAE